MEGARCSAVNLFGVTLDRKRKLTFGESWLSAQMHGQAGAGFGLGTPSTELRAQVRAEKGFNFKSFGAMKFTTKHDIDC